MAEKSQREYVIEQATEMFCTLGIKSVRMDDIASHLSISKRTLYEMFSDKESLLRLCMQHYYDGMYAQLREVGQKSSDLIDCIMISLDLILAHAETSRRLRLNLDKFYPEMAVEIGRSMEQRSRNGLHSYIRKGIVEGIFNPKIDIELSVSILHSSISGMFDHGRILLPENRTPEEVFRYMIVNFFRGISTVKGVEMIDRWNDRRKHSLNN